MKTNTHLPSLKIVDPSNNVICGDARPLDFGPDFVSRNQRLATGGPHPKTLVPPVITPPIAAWDKWSTPGIAPRNINSSTGFDMYHSGYSTGNEAIQNAPTCQYNMPFVPSVENYSSNSDQRPVHSASLNPLVNPSTTAQEQKQTLQMNRLQYELPSNFQAGQCMMTDEMKSYNQNLFTGMIEPGVYMQTQYTDPIPSNIGISNPPQNMPMTRTLLPDGSIYYTVRDPSFNTLEPAQEKPQTASNYNVYDPRSTGYGPSYRAYTEELTGQTRYMYDDIDSIRRPNFLIRSNIDHNKWANSYGPMFNQTKEGFNPQLADAQYRYDTLRFREELQAQYMRKYNNQVSWQRKMAPISTQAQVNTFGKRII